MPYNVFISYSWSNSAERLALTSTIEQIRSVSVLVDKRGIQPGEPVHERISKMIDDAHCVVVLLTPEGLKSREVLDELTRAHVRQKFIIPVVAEGTRLEDLPWFLRDLNWIPYNQRNFDGVVDTITRAIGRRADPLGQIDTKAVPSALRKQIKAGARFIDVPPENETHAGRLKEGDYLYYQLKMRQSEAVFAFRVPKKLELRRAAEYLAQELLPHLRQQDYSWVLTNKNREFPTEFTFEISGVKSGSTFYLLGNHRMPMWAPSIE